MLDIIIPVYNNYHGLLQSLNSIGNLHEKEEIKITIVDDCSTTITQENYEYIKQHYYWLDLQYIILDHNQGPGWARTYGLQNTNQDYILMLDCGDIIASPLALNEILLFLKDTPDYKFIDTLVAQGIDCDSVTDIQHLTNRIYVFEQVFCFYGKFISRQLYQQIQMPVAQSYCHEDVPFIAACEVITRTDGSYHYIDSKTPIVARLSDSDSLTHQDNYFSLAIPGYVENAIDLLEHNQFTDEIRKRIIYVIMLGIRSIIYSCDMQHIEQALNPQAIEDVQKFYYQYFEQYYPQCYKDPVFFELHIETSMALLQYQSDRHLTPKIDFDTFINFVIAGKFDFVLDLPE